MDIQFTSQGYTLLGTLYLSQSSDKHPAALFIHGIPGFEKNHDMAQHLNTLGWTCLVIHLRGAWGSEGTYNIPGQVDDSLAAIDFLMAQDANIEGLALVGYSLGSRTAIVTALQDARVGAVVSMSGIHDFSEMMIGQPLIDLALPVLSGVDADDLRKQWGGLIADRNPIEVAAQLAPRPLLVIHGGADEDVPSYSAAAIVEAAGATATLLMIEGADHGFEGKRETLIAGVSNWLENWRNQ